MLFQEKGSSFIKKKMLFPKDKKVDKMGGSKGGGTDECMIVSQKGVFSSYRLFGFW